jgi:Ca2+/Na+ antiporter
LICDLILLFFFFFVLINPLSLTLCVSFVCLIVFYVCSQSTEGDDNIENDNDNDSENDDNNNISDSEPTSDEEIDYDLTIRETDADLKFLANATGKKPPRRSQPYSINISPRRCASPPRGLHLIGYKRAEDSDKEHFSYKQKVDYQTNKKPQCKFFCHSFFLLFCVLLTFFV